MVDTCTIDRATGEATDAEGFVVTTYMDPPPYAGKCRVQRGRSEGESPEVASSSPSVQPYEVHIPVGAGPVEVGDVVWVGTRRFTVTATLVKTFQTAQRLMVDEVPR